MLHRKASVHPLACMTVHHQWPRLYLLRLAMGISSASYSQSWPCCSQRMEANTKQQSFHFQWAITQQHLGKRPCETSPSFFYIKQWWLHQHQLAHPSSPPVGSKHEGHFLLALLNRGQKQEFLSPAHLPLTSPPFFYLLMMLKSGIILYSQ